MAKAKQKITKDDIQKYAFWSLCLVALILPVIVTFLAVSSVAAKFEDQKKKLEDSMASVRKVSADAKHPNDILIEKIDRLTEEQTQKVMAAWARLEADQKKRNVWPDDLGQNFLRMIAEKKHGDEIEQLYLEHYFQFMRYRIPKMLDEVGARKMQQKKMQLNKETQEREPVKDADGNDIWEDVTPNWGIEQVSGAAGGTGGGFGGMSPGGAARGGGNPGAGSGSSFTGGGGMSGGGMSSGGGVGSGGMMGSGGGMPTIGGFGGPGGGPGGPGGMMSSGTSQGASGYVLSEYQRMVGGVDWLNPEIFQLQPFGVPQPIQIWYMQEDLWVYDALLWVIKETNRVTDEDAKKLVETHHKSPIKQITHLLIGRNAAMAMGQLKIIEGVTGLGTSSSMSSDSSSMMSSDPMSSGMDMGMGMGGGVSGSGQGANMATTGTYGWNIQDPEKLKTYILTNRYLDKELKPLGADAEPPYKEFNRMPVIMRLIVDQRSIPEVLANCANCAMPIDVLHVRVNPSKAGPMELPRAATSAMGGVSGGSSDSMMMDSSSVMGGGGGMSDPFGAGTGTGGGGGMSGGTGMESGTGYQVSGSVGVYNSEAIVVEIFGIINIYNSADQSAMAASMNAAMEERRRLAEEAQRQAESAAALAPDEVPAEIETEIEDETDLDTILPEENTEEPSLDEPAPVE